MARLLAHTERQVIIIFRVSSGSEPAFRGMFSRPDITSHSFFQSRIEDRCDIRIDFEA